MVIKFPRFCNPLDFALDHPFSLAQVLDLFGLILFPSAENVLDGSAPAVGQTFKDLDEFYPVVKAVVGWMFYRVVQFTGP
jgi:hypothetical protein